MVNTNELKGKIVASGYTQARLANELGISKNTLSDKINGKAPFTTDMVVKLCTVLGINDDEERIDIFLPQLSHLRDRSKDSA